MFFQAIYARYSLFGKSGVSVQLYVNKNALSSTYIGNADVTVGTNAFPVQVMNVSVYEDAG